MLTLGSGSGCIGDAIDALQCGMWGKCGVVTRCVSDYGILHDFGIKWGLASSINP
jgi:hypothetical protein